VAINFNDNAKLEAATQLQRNSQTSSLRFRVCGSFSNIMSDPAASEAEKNIEVWKVKKLIKRLEAARGNGTSMISLIIRELSLSDVELHH
jgi:hypothetical protein